jgi:hypothetical protein
MRRFGFWEYIFVLGACGILGFAVGILYDMKSADAMTRRHDNAPAVIPSPDPTPLASPSPLAAVPVPTPTGSWITVGSITGAMPGELPMIADGVRLANQAFGTYCFKQWVLAASYSEAQGLSQDEVWQKIWTHPVSVDVEMYMGDFRANHIARTVGYENEPYDGIVHMNRYYVNTASMVADNLLHEGEGHSQGFTHYLSPITASQPYGMNYAYEGCTHAQEQQAPGGKPYRPPGIRLEMRHRHRRPAVNPSAMHR